MTESRSTADIESDILTVLGGITHSWAAWAPTLRGAGTARGRSGTTDSATLLAASARREARDMVSPWVHRGADERHDWKIPGAGIDVPGMCEYLARHACWLSGHEAVEDLLSELGEAARRLDAILPRGRSTWITLGACPHCQSDVRGDTDAERVRCGHCEREGSWREWEGWLLGPREYVTSPRLPEFIRLAVGVTVSGMTVWRWIKAGRIQAQAHAPSAVGVAAGTPLYDPWDAVWYALTRNADAGAA